MGGAVGCTASARSDQADIRALVAYLRSIPADVHHLNRRRSRHQHHLAEEGRHHRRLAGRKVFAQACVSCHSWTGVSASRRRQESRASARSTIRTGPIRASGFFQHATFTPGAMSMRHSKRLSIPFQRWRRSPTTLRVSFGSAASSSRRVAEPAGQTAR